MLAICSTALWKMRSEALMSPATLHPCQFCFVVTQLTLESAQTVPLFFHHSDHRLKVRDVYRERKDAFGVVVLYDAFNGWHELAVHCAVATCFVFACRERTVKRSRHDVSPAMPRGSS